MSDTVSSTIPSVIDYGGSAILVDIECHISNGLPNIVIVGFANKAVDEAKERIRSAFSSCQLELPRKRITINLAPADIPKESTSFDLAIAASILKDSGQIRLPSPTRSVIFGELGLDGTVRPCRGIIGKLLAARKLDFTKAYVPKENLKQALLVNGMHIAPVSNLRELYLDLTSTSPIPSHHGTGKAPETGIQSPGADFMDVVGQARAKRALEIAAAGNHNILLSGPPGTGKSMLAKALPSILPPLTSDEVLEITQLHSLSTNNYDQLVTNRPFRAPHHSASLVSIVGGGQYPRPGEISLSHKGVLFLDELPEFSKTTLEALRQPLEDKTITVARAKDSLNFPADFMLVATANPCPCGYFGTSKACSCTAAQVAHYRQKLSGPILDRIDLYIDVDEVNHAHLLGQSTGERSADVRKRVENARHKQYKRFKKTGKTNASLTNRDIKLSASLSADAKTLLDEAANKLAISARAYMRTVKVARTIADLGGSKEIQTRHITEALQYRRTNQNTL